MLEEAMLVMGNVASGDGPGPGAKLWEEGGGAFAVG
jgi:hypothetical protein